MLDRSTNRKNRVCVPPIYPCETPIPGTDVPFRRDRMLRVNQALIAIAVKKPASSGLLHVLRSGRHQFSRATALR
jgi:hypothetical protein